MTDVFAIGNKKALKSRWDSLSYALEPFKLTRKGGLVPRIMVDKHELAEEIRRYVEKTQGVELTQTQVLRYMEDPTNYTPAPRLVEGVFQHFRKDNPIYTTERAIALLRQPFTESRREFFAEKVVVRLGLRKSAQEPQPR